MSESIVLSTEALRDQHELLPTHISERLRDVWAVVLFDLDKTAINENYQPTNQKGLQQAIDRLQNSGVLIGIHSDSPRETIMQFADDFGVKGPLIYEMAGIHIPSMVADEAGVDIVLDPEAGDYFDWLRNKVFDFVNQLYPGKNADNLRYLITSDQDRNKDKRKNATYRGYDRGLWLNPHRQFSLGLWAEGIDSNGNTVRDDEFHDEIYQVVQQVVDYGASVARTKATQLDWDANENYGVVILKKKTLADKTAPVRDGLLPFMNELAQVYMIGDSPSDFIDLERVQTLAVGNAQQELKNKIEHHAQSYPDISPKPMHIIARKDYSDGVIEHMQAIADRFDVAPV